MFEKLRHLPDDWINFFMKIVIPALVGVGIKIAVQMKRERVSLLSICLSIIIGCGFSFLLGFAILQQFNPKYVPAIAGLVGIMGEKIGIYLIYKWKVDVTIQHFINLITRKK